MLTVNQEKAKKQDATARDLYMPKMYLIFHKTTRHVYSHENCFYKLFLALANCPLFAYLLQATAHILSIALLLEGLGVKQYLAV